MGCRTVFLLYNHWVCLSFKMKPLTQSLSYGLHESMPKVGLQVTCFHLY